jgi:hypothetical protein
MKTVLIHLVVVYVTLTIVHQVGLRCCSSTSWSVLLFLWACCMGWAGRSVGDWLVRKLA